MQCIYLAEASLHSHCIHVELITILVVFCLRIVSVCYSWSPAPSSSWRVVLVVKTRLFDVFATCIGDVLNLILVHRIILGYAVVLLWIL